MLGYHCAFLSYSWLGARSLSTLVTVGVWFRDWHLPFGGFKLGQQADFATDSRVLPPFEPAPVPTFKTCCQPRERASESTLSKMISYHMENCRRLWIINLGSFCSEWWRATQVFWRLKTEWIGWYPALIRRATLRSPSLSTLHWDIWTPGEIVAAAPRRSREAPEN